MNGCNTLQITFDAKDYMVLNCISFYFIERFDAVRSLEIMVHRTIKYTE